MYFVNPLIPLLSSYNIPDNLLPFSSKLRKHLILIASQRRRPYFSRCFYIINIIMAQYDVVHITYFSRYSLKCVAKFKKICWFTQVRSEYSVLLTFSFNKWTSCPSPTLFISYIPINILPCLGVIVFFCSRPESKIGIDWLHLSPILRGFLIEYTEIDISNSSFNCIFKVNNQPEKDSPVWG